MNENVQNARDKIRRSIGAEFVRMEDDFDSARSKREVLVDKLMESASHVKLLRDDNTVNDDTDTGLRVITTALKALTDMEKASSQAIILKLKNQEQEMASAAAAKDRIEIILKATAPGRIETEFPAEDLETTLSTMFDGDIKDFELKTNPKDLED